ncbi:MAG: phosphoribosyl-AMP cyclohydrolase, partial [Flavobacteriales bacterium]|nr:phosphoribosyl-AMP cyclohydrolase [Flavobacteriales bacterium]
MQISEEEVLQVQQNWSNGVVEIGKKFDNNLDYISYAEEFLDKLYNFRNGDVLFKPTFASESQFRLNKASALSYFIGDNQEFNEDKGFALSCW